MVRNNSITLKSLKSRNPDKKEVPKAVKTARQKTFAYDRLYQKSKERAQKKQILEKEVMREEGCSFAPQICEKSRKLSFVKQQKKQTRRQSMKENFEVSEQFETYTISCNTQRGLNISPLKNQYIPNYQRV